MESEKKLILDVNESPKKAGQWIILAVQHLLAMFVACITVPLIVFNSYVVGQDFANAGAKVSYVGLNGQSFASALIAPTLVAAGICTWGSPRRERNIWASSSPPPASALSSTFFSPR